jgi:hypothetical protein
MTVFQDRALVALAGGVVTLLVVASIAGWILSRRVTAGPGRATVDNINARTCVDGTSERSVQPISFRI